MINPIYHGALRAAPMIHDEEAPTVLELAGQLGSKMNEVVRQTNENTDGLEKALKALPKEISDTVYREIENGNLPALVGDAVLDEIGGEYERLEKRIDALVMGEGDSNPEIVDARNGSDGTVYATLRGRLNAIEYGSAFNDAVRPGTVRAGRLTAGMLAGELRDRYTIREYIPMAGHWDGTGYYNRETHEPEDHTGYSMSAPIPCEYGDVFLLTSYIYGNQVSPAVILDADLKVIDVVGAMGKGDWTPIPDEIHVTKGTAAYIRFICGASYVGDFRAVRIAIRENPDRDLAMGGKGFIHMRAKNRTNTVTDRAQIRCWFKLPDDRTGSEIYDVPIQLHKWTNLGGMTFRVFGATSAATYDMQLAESAAGYTFPVGYGIHPYFSVPLNSSTGAKITHVCLYVDLIAARPEEYINVYMPALTMNGIAGEGYSLHGSLNSDHLSIVLPGAMGSPLYNKRILGVGDSLMAAYNLTNKALSWFDIMCGNHGAIWHNASINGQAVTEMATTISAALAACKTETGAFPDFCIVQGGANDLRLDKTIEEFKAALRQIANVVMLTAPKCRILFCTNWRRSKYTTPAGNVESDYVTAMLEVAEELGVPVYNAYLNSIDLTDSRIAAWADEGITGGGGASLHFSAEANRVIASQIGEALRRV